MTLVREFPLAHFCTLLPCSNISSMCESHLQNWAAANCSAVLQPDPEFQELKHLCTSSQLENFNLIYVTTISSQASLIHSLGCSFSSCFVFSCSSPHPGNSHHPLTPRTVAHWGQGGQQENNDYQDSVCDSHLVECWGTVANTFAGFGNSTPISIPWVLSLANLSTKAIQTL